MCLTYFDMFIFLSRVTSVCTKITSITQIYKFSCLLCVIEHIVEKSLHYCYWFRPIFNARVSPSFIIHISSVNFHKNIYNICDWMKCLLLLFFVNQVAGQLTNVNTTSYRHDPYLNPSIHFESNLEPEWYYFIYMWSFGMCNMGVSCRSWFCGSTTNWSRQISKKWQTDRQRDTLTLSLPFDS